MMSDREGINKFHQMSRDASAWLLLSLFPNKRPIIVLEDILLKQLALLHHSALLVLQIMIQITLRHDDQMN